MSSSLDIPRFLRTVFFVGVFSSLFSCKTTELVFYEHLPSSSFYENYELDNPALEEYRADEILFVISIKATRNRTEYIVWQGLYSKLSNKAVKIEKAILCGDNLTAETVLSQIVLLDDEIEKASLLAGSARLFQVNAGSFEGLSNTREDIYLTVYYEIDGRKGVMNYLLKRRIEKQNIYPT